MARGHIYRRTLKDGTPSRWYAVIDTAPRGERRRQVTRSFATRREAQQWLAQTAAASPDSGTGPTLGEYLQRWLDGKVAVKPSTRASYRAHVERYLQPMLGEVPLGDLSAQQVRAFHADLLAAGVAPPTVARVHATLSSALGTARRLGLLDRDPLAGVELPRRRPYRRATWTAQEASRFLAGVRGDQLEGLWRLALIGGLRRGELLGLRWCDLDLVAGTADIERSRLRLGADILEDDPKTAASRRRVHLDARTAAVLRAARPAGSHRAGEHVFTGADGAPLDPAAITRCFQQVRQSLGLPRIRLHDLRHTSATLGLASGESLKEVSARLGHAGLQVTADLYADVAPDLARASAQRLAAGLDRPQAAAPAEGAA